MLNVRSFILKVVRSAKSVVVRLAFNPPNPFINNKLISGDMVILYLSVWLKIFLLWLSPQKMRVS
jgi:hypothetical protein